MNRYLFGLIGLGLLGMSQLVFAADAPAVVTGACPDACVPKVCVPIVEIKKIDKRVYSNTCEDFCLPKCSLLGGFLHHKDCADACDGCTAEHGCGHPRTRKYLVVKIHHEETCVNKCIVTQQPACVIPCQGAPIPVGKPGTAPEPLPVPLPK